MLSLPENTDPQNSHLQRHSRSLRFTTMIPRTLLTVVCVLIINPVFIDAAANASFNPFIRPESDDVARPGSTFAVMWKPISSGPVSLFVRNFGGTTGIVIADSIEASTGQYNWFVPTSLAANASDSDPYQFEMRMYEGSIGLSTLDVTPFESRTYDWSTGYFAITNNATITAPPLDPSIVVSVSVAPTPRPTGRPKGHKIQITIVRGGTTTVITSTQDVESTPGVTGVQTSATRIPTFESVLSHGRKAGFEYWTAALVVWGILVGGIVL